MSLFSIACRFVSHITLLFFLLTHAIQATFGTQPFLAAFRILWLESLRTESLDVLKAYILCFHRQSVSTNGFPRGTNR